MLYTLFRVLFLMLSFVCLANHEDKLDPYFVQLNKNIGNSPNDVLQQLLNNPIIEDNPHKKAQHHYSLSQVYLRLVYPKKSIKHANLALKLIDHNVTPRLFHLTNIAKSQSLDILNRTNEGLLLTNTAVNWAKQNNDTELLIEALFGLGYLQNTSGNSVDALASFMQAYELAPIKGDTLTKSAIASSIALVYEYRSEAELAIPYFQESVNYQRKENNQLELSISLYGLGRANKNIGEKELGKNQLQESLEISRKIKDIQGVAYALKELASFEIETGDFKRAESMLIEASEILLQSQNIVVIWDTLDILSKVYISMGDIKRAQQIFDTSLTYLSQETMPFEYIASKEREAQLLSLDGKHKQAYELSTKTFIEKQKLQSQQSTKQLHELRTRFELESKAKENLLLTQKNEQHKFDLYKQDKQNHLLWFGIVTTTIIIFLLGLLVYRSREQKKVLHKLANTDSLTGLANRYNILNRIKQIQNKLRPTEKIYLCILDFDYFKKVNDKFGHGMGDNVLKAFAQICKNNLQYPNQVGRIGGEEFLLLLNVRDSQTAITLVDLIKQKTPKIAQQTNIPKEYINFSAGICTYTKEDNLKTQLKKADDAMYKAKEEGRNRIIVAT